MSMGVAGSRPLTPEQESRILEYIIRKSIAKPMKEGDVFYVLSNRWFLEWRLYVGHGEKSFMFGSKPGRIDNSDLVLDPRCNNSDTEPEVRNELKNGTDFVLLPKDVWTQLYKWYGGGPILPRKVVAAANSSIKVAVDVYRFWLLLVVAPEEKQFTLRMSKKDTLGELYRRACELLKLRSEQIHIWNYKGRTRRNLLVYREDQTLEEAKIEMGQEILLEVVGMSSYNSRKTLNLGGETNVPENLIPNTVIKRHHSPNWRENDMQTLWQTGKRCRSNSSAVQENDTAIFPAKPQRSRIYAHKDDSRSSPVTSQRPHISAHKDKSSYSPVELDNFLGLRGLQNLGNTCYMNSALQCVLHIPELVEFFLGDYQEHINYDNPLGYKGNLATAFGDLLREAWSPGLNFAPDSFRQTFGVLKPNFAGPRQEDAQEFLIVLLDGLHEDLNRVKNKPYTQIDDDNECSDEILADKYHAIHKEREDSIIQDLFGGQYRGTLLCTTCGKVKRQFDSFTHLLVTFPKTLKTRVTVFSSDGIERPAQHTITVNQDGTYQDIVNALSYLCSIRADEKLLLAEISNCQIVRYLEKLSDPFSSTADNVGLVAYRLPVVQEKLPLIVLHHQIQSEEVRKLAPLVAYLGHRTQTGADVQAVVRTLLAPILRTQIQENEDGDVDMDFNETSISTEEESSFLLYLADENGNKTQTILKEDEPIPVLDSSERLQVIVEWTEGQLKRYETECLRNLPIAKRQSENKIKNEELNLYTMLESTFKERVLSLNEAWYCPQCKEFRLAIQKQDIWRLPEILIVFLVRFHNDEYHTYQVKTFVDFPIDGFDLSKFVGNKNDTKGHIYKLFAITNHSGALNSGHYTAIVNVRDRWYNFNDSTVNSIGEEGIKTAKAYLLFYRRVNPEDNFTRGK